jgi:hypothetical protein
MSVVQGFRVASLFGLWGMMIAVASAAAQGLPGPIAVPGARGVQLQGSKGIGPLVSALATSGVHGQQLAAMIRALQAARGIGQGHAGKVAGGKGGLGGAGPFDLGKAPKGDKGRQVLPGGGQPGLVPLLNLGGQQAKPGGKLPVPGGAPADPGDAIPGGKLPPGRAQPGFVPQFGPGGKQILPGGGPFGKGKGGQGGHILPGGDKQGVLPPLVPGGKGGFGGGGPFGKGKGKK